MFSPDTNIFTGQTIGYTYAGAQTKFWAIECGRVITENLIIAPADIHWS
jgi:hypothetical protein